ncbi:hypothetical protein ACFWC5_16540 [Streptomyces sp. NPDC060085]|uniref:hypothetical protein n=1 Tax=Streptomyces sp. NPDC060085 TaxID=3347054 RepID=UPI003660BEBD
MRLTYTHGHPAVPYDYEDTLENWYVSVRAFHDDEKECDDGCTEACERLIEVGSEVGWLRLWRLRDYTGEDRWTVADAESGDLESIVAVVLEDGEYSGAFEEVIECPVGDLLILDRVFLSRPWRGFGLGPVIAAEAVRRLSGGCCAVASEPGMAEWPEDRDEVTEAYRATAKRKIAALWESIGFHVFQDGVQLLDTSLREPADLLRQRREDLHELSAAYQAHLDGRTTVKPRPGVTFPARAQLPAQHEPPHQPDPGPQTVEERGDGLAAAASLAEFKQRCASSGWSHNDRTIALKAAERATHDTDLRELAAQVGGVYFGLRDAWADALTFPGRRFDLRPFRQNPAALGPLASVWVYGSNLDGRYQGRSHAVGGACQHSRFLNPDTQRMTLAQLVELDSFWEWNGPSCAFCDGWSGQRLTAIQHAHYLSAPVDLRG